MPKRIRDNDRVPSATASVVLCSCAVGIVTAVLFLGSPTTTKTPQLADSPHSRNSYNYDDVDLLRQFPPQYPSCDRSSSRIAKHWKRIRGGLKDPTMDVEEFRKQAEKRDEERKLFREKLEELRDMSISDLKREMDKRGIKYRDLCEKYMFKERLAEFEAGILDKEFIGEPRKPSSGNSKVEEIDDEEDSKPKDDFWGNSGGWGGGNSGDWGSGGGGGYSSGGGGKSSYGGDSGGGNVLGGGAVEEMDELE